MYQGDPGFFDFIGKAVKGVGKVVGGIAKTVGGAAKGFLTGGPLGAVTGAISANLPAGGVSRVSPRQAVLKTNSLSGSMPGTGNRFAPGVGFQSGPGGTGLGYFPAAGGGGTVGRNGAGCPVGYHAIKDPKRSDECTRNRTMNPLNPRALSRALRRITSAKRATKFLGRVSIRKACK
jgi:hypothetical protein